MKGQKSVRIRNVTEWFKLCAVPYKNTLPGKPVSYVPEKISVGAH